MPQQLLSSPSDCLGEGLTPGDAVVENRYAAARPNAAAIIAACWSGGAIKTSFFRGLRRMLRRNPTRCPIRTAPRSFCFSLRSVKGSPKSEP